MKKSNERTPNAPAYRDRVQYDGEYRPPTKRVEEKSEKLIRLYPPKAVGPIHPKMCEEVMKTPTAAKILLETNHYESGGIWIHARERDHYFRPIPRAEAPETYQATVDPRGNVIGVEGLPQSPGPVTPPVEDEVVLPKKPITEGPIYDKVLAYLIDNNFNTPGRLQKMSLQDWYEKYTIPSELLKDI